MRSFLITFFVIAVASPLHAQSQTERQAQCRFQAELAGAVQQARLDRVQQDNVLNKLKQDNPDWPAAVDQAIPPLVNFVYSIKRRDLRGVDLEAQTYQSCLANYDRIQEMKKSVSN